MTPSSSLSLPQSPSAARTSFVDHVALPFVGEEGKSATNRANTARPRERSVIPFPLFSLLVVVVFWREGGGPCRDAASSPAFPLTPGPPLAASPSLSQFVCLNDHMCAPSPSSPSSHAFQPSSSLSLSSPRAFVPQRQSPFAPLPPPSSERLRQHLLFFPRPPIPGPKRVTSMAARRVCSLFPSISSAILSFFFFFLFVVFFE